MESPLLTLRHIEKRFGAVQALRDVSLDVMSGSVLGLVGENGAGKSTLIGILAGSLRPDAGEVYLNGKPVRFTHPLDARRAGIAVVHQEPQVVETFTVAQNVVLGNEPVRGRFPWLDARQAYNEVERLIALYGMTQLKPDTSVADLNLASRYLVAILRALSLQADLLILDEPTASSTPDEARQLLTILEQLSDQGKAVIFVSHRVPEVLAVADRFIVLRDGEVSGTLTRESATEDKLVRLMVGRAIEEVDAPRHVPGDVLLTVEGVSVPPYLHDISLELRKGEILGLAGLVGSGRSRLGRTIFSDESNYSGRIVRHASLERPGAVALLPEDRKAQGLVPATSVFQNAILAKVAGMPHFTRLPLASLRRDVQRLVARLDLTPREPSADIGELSGGNQQKVVLAKWLMVSPDIFILDEPTRGVDVGARAEIHAIIRQLATDGLAILLISSDLPELLLLSDRILVMAEGRLVAQFEQDDATEEAVMRAAVLRRSHNEDHALKGATTP